MRRTGETTFLWQMLADWLAQGVDREGLSGRANLGHALETAVLLELERRGADVTYIRTASGFEVDFLARYADGRDALIQVCTDLADPATRERETRALVEAASEHRRATCHLISLEPEIPSDLPAGVTVHAASAWLLAPHPS